MSWIRNTADSDSPKSLKVPIFVLKYLLKVAYDPVTLKTTSKRVDAAVNPPMVDEE
jgi:hypothetical protein